MCPGISSYLLCFPFLLLDFIYNYSYTIMKITFLSWFKEKKGEKANGLSIDN